jgi:hypothetical protein
VIRTYGPGCRDCRYDVVEIPTLDAWPFALFPSHLLLSLDASRVRDRQLTELADSLLTAGLHAVLCHGPDCERVHDVFAEREAVLDAQGRLDRDMDAVVDVSFHDAQRFADVLFSFAMFRPHETYPIPTVRTAVLIDRPREARDIHRWLPVFCERRPS